ncbi:MAG: NADPH:quinone oxidoreductase family protein [Burkholderiales bacterium]
MKAIWVEAATTPAALRVQEVPAPQPQPHEVQLAVHAAGLNFLDTLMVADQYQVKPPKPYAPGTEVAGVITQVGADVKHLAVGDRVMSMCNWGAFAETTCVAANMAFPVPAGVSLEVAATFPITYGTVYHALLDRAQLRHDEWLVVHGAGSGVGLNAVELGHLMGARVIAVASSAAKLDVARGYGAEVLLDSTRDDVRARVLELTGGRGADVVFDPVGGPVFDAAMRYIAPAGRLLVVGFASGTIPTVRANLALLKGCSIVGVNTTVLIREDLAEYSRRFAMLLRWVAEGRLRPLIGARYPLEQVPQAMQALLDRKVTGKAVICIRDEAGPQA